MKGLLLKDLYAIKSYFRSFLLLIAIFLLMPFLGNNSTFFLFYPCIFAGVFAMSLISYEEREKWNVYVCTLPYSRTQLVSSKYLISLIIGGCTLFASLLVQAVRMYVNSSFSAIALLILAATMIAPILLPTAILLPFIYRFGAEKGRLVYYFVIGAFCAIAGFINISSADATDGVDIIGGADAPTADFLTSMGLKIAITIALVSIALFAASWLLSIKIYQKREMR